MPETKNETKDKRFYTTLINTAVSTILLVLIVLFYIINADEKWAMRSPGEITMTTYKRNPKAGIFTPNKDVYPARQTKQVGTQTVVDTQKMAKEWAEEIQCYQYNEDNEMFDSGPRCQCLVQKFVTFYASASLTVGSQKASWERFLKEIPSCKYRSTSWELEVHNQKNKTWMGVVAWWTFSIVIMSIHVLFDWDWTDWLKVVGFVIFFLLVPLGVGCFVIYLQEGLSIWIFMIAVQVVIFFVLYIVVDRALTYRVNVHDGHVSEYKRKLMMSALIMFAFIANTIITQQFSGRNEITERNAGIGLSICIGLVSIAMRLINEALEENDRLMVKDKSPTAELYRKSILFCGQ
eukprot:2887469-Rhodomonas_salina.1